VPLTHFDWMLTPVDAVGGPVLRHELDACKASGWSRAFRRGGCGARNITVHARRLISRFRVPFRPRPFIHFCRPCAEFCPLKVGQTTCAGHVDWTPRFQSAGMY